MTGPLTAATMTAEPAVTSPADGPPGEIRVLIADDEALVRAGFRVLVDSAPDLHVVGEAADGIQAVRQARALRPDVVLMDLRMPIMHGLEATKVILDGDGDGDGGGDGGGGGGTAGAGQRPRVLVVTTFDEDEHVFEALRSGASGFILKDTPPEQLLDAIRVIAGGDALLTPAITRRLIAEFARSPRPAPPPGGALAQLTERERQVLVQVAAGLSNAEIAARLHLSIPTVKTHVSRLLSKVGGRDRAQLVVFAYEAGVTTPGRRPG
jgi:DNA-binding NarL/FixJ family response regulator